MPLPIPAALYFVALQLPFLVYVAAQRFTQLYFSRGTTLATLIHTHWSGQLHPIISKVVERRDIVASTAAIAYHDAALTPTRRAPKCANAR